ncbi:MAG: hypothetical protein Q7K33_02595, partial [Candidatus Berkelbacteria bacterium]|nr:hypothetical protein [Candidatus Berkelbacteria bacterium]
MARDSFGRSLLIITSAILLVAQPFFSITLSAIPRPTPVYAQIDKPEEEELVPEGEGEAVDSSEDAPLEPADFQIETLDDLGVFYEIQNSLKMSPDDVTQLKESKVDIRVTDYLLRLVLPEEYGGYGFDHIKVNRILKNYTSEGAGKYDREGTQSVTDEGDIVSGHNRGQALDISEVGSVTCKLVYKRHLGGSTTKWQKPLPVKVAWQSTEGVKNNPTPTAQSILGASGEMSAQSILAYLNESGEMDYYIEFVKGMDLKTIVGYVGANIYLKTFGVNQVLSDPFADGLLHALGGSVLEKVLPGLPAGLNTGDNDEDARVAFAKSRLEQGLNLPAGSLKGYGWDNILQATGKRHLETSLGIPSGYFDKHT